MNIIDKLRPAAVRLRALRRASAASSLADTVACHYTGMPI
jgi:hypothetical protein